MPTRKNPGFATPAPDSRPGIPTGADFVASYDGSRGHQAPCSKAQWRVVRPSLLVALAPVSGLSPYAVRRYANAYARLAAWAIEQGLDLDPARLLSPDVAEAYLASQTKGRADQRAALRRLARAHGIEEAATPLGYVRRPALAPYSELEVEALWSYASGLSNVTRRTGLSALLALGLGAGLSRSSLRGVGAEDVHRHGDDPFVRTSGRCAKVRPEFVARLKEVASSRPSGDLIGQPTRNITSSIVEWASGRVGVPPLRPDRLRSTYICRWLEDGASLLELMAWTGMRRLDSIDHYLDYVEPPHSLCSVNDVSGAL
jgi:integrase